MASKGILVAAGLGIGALLLLAGSGSAKASTASKTPTPSPKPSGGPSPSPSPKPSTPNPAPKQPPPPSGMSNCTMYDAVTMAKTKLSVDQLQMLTLNPGYNTGGVPFGINQGDGTTRYILVMCSG